MTQTEQTANWRLQVARDVITAAFVNQTDVAMIVLVGSVARAMEDDLSDIDLVMVWSDTPDLATLTNIAHGLNGHQTELTDTADADTDPALVSWGQVFYLYGDSETGLKIDITHKTRASAEHLLDDVLVRYDTHTIKCSVAYSLRRAIALHGEPVLMGWQSRLADFPHGLQFALLIDALTLSPVWGLEMLITRDDMLYFQQLFSDNSWKLLKIWMILSHQYPPHTPKHSRSLLTDLTVKPDNLMARWQTILNGTPSVRLQMMADLAVDTFHLIGQHVPQLDITAMVHRFHHRRAQLNAAHHRIDT